ncbi:MAG: hypothetical protein IJS26_01440 [Alphaproteobacteria bacterium]|nr:hypothetical protein [Alphaproteobacteria bacterium]
MKEVEIWIKKIEKAEKKYAPYFDLIGDIRRYYKNENARNEQNMFWTTIETLKPFLYFKGPKPFVQQQHQTGDLSASCACRILEKALKWDLAQFDFDGIMKYVRNDFLLFGFASAYEQYVPKFKKASLVKNGSETVFDVLDDETIETIYIKPEDFIADVEKVDVWEDVSWFARKIEMSRNEIINQFGKELASFLCPSKDTFQDNITVYEIWDKTDKQILYLAKECDSRFLKIRKNAAEITGFFAMPKPLFATLANDGLIVVPDYVQLKPLLNELQGITSRMQLTMQAIKVSGAYDNSFPELANILNKEVTLVAVSDFDRLKENGGLKGIMDFAPIEQYVNALQALALRRQDIIDQIYEMTGVSDIMRGTSDKTETATAVTKKTNFGTLRNQDRQNELLRFITDLLTIKAEMICECFSAEHLKMFADSDVAPEIADKAVMLLKENKLRGMILGVETDISLIQEEVALKIQNALGVIHNLIVQAFNVVSSQPLLLPLYKQMILSVLQTLPNARQYEQILEKTFDSIALELQKQPTPVLNTALLQIKQQEQKMMLDHRMKEKEFALKTAEFSLKEKEQKDKKELTEKEMNLQALLKAKQIEKNQAKNDANISTGYVKEF